MANKRKAAKKAEKFTGTTLLQMVLDHPDTPKDPTLILRALAWATGELSVAIAPPKGGYSEATLAIALDGINSARKAAGANGPFAAIGG